MTATLIPKISNDEIFTLDGISWETYTHLLEDLSKNRRLKLTYYKGKLEIMSPSPEHEYSKEVIGRFVETLAEELDIKIHPLGSTTFKRISYGGAEPDKCFYVSNIELIRNIKRFKPNEEIAPDLIVEVDITSTSQNRLAIYQDLGVREIWLYNGDNFKILQLTKGEYTEANNSLIFADIPLLEINSFMQKLGDTDYFDLIKRFRQWVRKNINNK